MTPGASRAMTENRRYVGYGTLRRFPNAAAVVTARLPILGLQVDGLVISATE